ncbi:histidine--tRNA ligase [Candidatus Woesearchaeota archaeon]|nr:histidine--tRNA ligase [Candidatus Woesearchaeota archaeon]
MKLQLPKGTRDVAQEAAIARSKIVSTLKDVFELYGFSPLETPLFERYEVLASKYAGGAEILKESFKFKDQGKRELGLRYDLTVPMCRYIAMNPQMKLPFKRYAIGEVFRDGPVEKARYRQFTQCDVDVVGNSSMNADAEIITLVSRAFKKLNLDAVIKFNNRNLLNELLEDAGVNKDKTETAILSIDKLEKFGIDYVKKELKDKKVSEEEIKSIEKIIKIKGTNIKKINEIKKLVPGSEGIKEIEELISILKSLKIIAEFDISLARGLSYYTGTVVEVFLKNSSVKSAVCAGGRYDNIIGSFIGRGNFPAVGISFGLDRIYDAYMEKNKDNKKTTAKVYIVPINTLEDSVRIAEELRNEKVSVDIDLAGRGPSKNLKYANSLGIPYVLFVGEEELKQGKVKLKDMNSGEEKSLTAEELVVFLQEND